MKASGIGVGLTALGGATLAAGDQHQGGDNETAAGDGMEEDAGNASGALVDDLIDPVFGYPLAADETDGVDIDTVVELYQSEEDTHGDFPKHPEKGESYRSSSSSTPSASR